MKKKIELLTLAKTFNLLPFFIAGLLFILSCLAIGFLYGQQKLCAFSQKHAYLLRESNSLLSKEATEALEDDFSISAKAHLRDFIELFFAYDKQTYAKRIERALWLGDDSIKTIYENLSYWFTLVSQNHLITKILWEDPQMDISLDQKKSSKTPFTLKCKLEIDHQGEKKSFFLPAKGTLMEVSKNFPLNPHGLLICNFSYLSKPMPNS
jgi:hypothetical protein